MSWGLFWVPGDRVWPVRTDRPGWIVVRGSPPVARSSSLTAQVLIALGPERLAELPPAMAGRLRQLDQTADVGDGHSLGDPLPGGSMLRRSLRLELGDDLDSFTEAFGYGCVPGPFHGEVPGPV